MRVGGMAGPTPGWMARLAATHGQFDEHRPLPGPARCLGRCLLPHSASQNADPVCRMCGIKTAEWDTPFLLGKLLTKAQVIFRCQVAKNKTMRTTKLCNKLKTKSYESKVGLDKLLGRGQYSINS